MILKRNKLEQSNEPIVTTAINAFELLYQMKGMGNKENLAGIEIWRASELLLNPLAKHISKQVKIASEAV